METALRVVSTQTMRWSAPTRFNDPFDVPRGAQVDFTIEQLRDACDREHLRLIETGDPTFHPKLRLMQQVLAEQSGATRRSIVQEYLAQQSVLDPPRSDAFDVLEAIWRTQSAQLRILCLSELYDSPSMWDRYASGHTGVVLELACPDETESALLAACPIEYRDTRPRLPNVDWWAKAITLQPSVDLSELWSDYFYVKHTDWQVEREWRVVTYAADNEGGDFSDWPFDPVDLTAIYVGYRAGEAAVAKLRDALCERSPHTRLMRASLNHDTLRVSIVPIGHTGAA